MMFLEHFWGKALVKMASKMTKTTQENKSTTASNADKAQDGGTEIEQLSLVMTKATTTVTVNIANIS